jgi:CubicO group peptidase (beta-lactamase class C family)
LDAAVTAARERGEVPGAVLVVGRGERVLKTTAYGARRYEPEIEPMRCDTIFDLASLTKVAATATALALLAGEGAVALDDPVSRHLPEWPDPDLTLRHLATHTSGFRPYLDAGRVSETYAGLPGDAAVIAAIREHDRAGKPGAACRYSCLNYLLLARALEAAAGCDLEQYLGPRLWRPLGMDDTAWRIPENKLDRCAPTTARLCGRVHDPLARMYGLRDHLPGNAGLFSTGPDLARFMGVLASGGSWGGRRILASATVDLLLADQVPAGSPASRAVGWIIAREGPYVPEAGTHDIRYHAGFTGTFLWLDRTSGVYFVLLTSRLYPYEKGNALPLRKEIARIVAGELLPGTQPLTAR